MTSIIMVIVCVCVCYLCILFYQVNLINISTIPFHHSAFSISADVRRYTSSILQSLFAYFIDRKSVSYFGFGEKGSLRMHQIHHFPKPFHGRATNPLPMEKGHYCASATTTLPRASP
jgi:hypothetical protein